MWPGGENRPIRVGRERPIDADQVIMHSLKHGFVPAMIGDWYCGVALEYGRPGDIINCYVLPSFSNGEDELVNLELARLGWSPVEIKRCLR